MCDNQARQPTTGSRALALLHMNTSTMDHNSQHGLLFRVSSFCQLLVAERLDCVPTSLAHAES